MNGARNLKVSSGLFVAILISLIAFGCENPGSVGGGIGDSDINVADTTIFIPGTSIDSVDAYSGLLGSFSSGIFDDPLFGRVRATSLLKPSLLAFDDIFGANIEMKLRLQFDSRQVYGDSTSQADFELVEIDELWRGKAWRYSDEPPLPPSSGMLSSVVATFSVSNQDSIEVTLGQNWVNKYRTIYNNSDNSERDSLYLNELFGLAIVPENEAQIIPFNSSSSEFVIEQAEDTTVVPLRDWATSIERTGQSTEPAETSLAYSTLEKLMSFKMSLTAEEFGTSVNISNVELIIPVDVETMKQSLDPLPNNTLRPDSTLAELYLLNTQIFSESIGPSAPLTTGVYSAADSSYHFDITPLVNSTLIDGVNSNERFYITLNSNDGVIRSSLFFNENAPDGKRPRINVTYIKSEDL